jgi:hypothetical protein
MAELPYKNASLIYGNIYHKYCQLVANMFEKPLKNLGF